MISINAHPINVINYVLALNSVPIIWGLEIKNENFYDITDLRIRISFEPDIAYCEELQIGGLLSKTAIQITNIIPTYNLGFLSNIKKECHAKVKFHVYIDDNSEVYSCSPIHITNYSFYWGNSVLSKYLASYVLPYDKAIVQIVKRATELYQMYTDCVFPENVYKDTKHTLHIVRSMYESIQERQLSFAYPIKNLNIYGQRIRTPNEIMDQNKGCCLDMALLFCSCLEYIGMNSILILQDDHALAGCWLVNNVFDESPMYNTNLLIEQSRCANPTIVLVETTYMIYKLKRAVNEIYPFNKAVLKASEVIMKNTFNCAVDIFYSRKDGILPFTTFVENTK